MSYVTTVQSKTPLFFGYLNELSGEVITDYSANGHDGTYYPEAVRGHPSPIENDASSFSVNNRVGTTPCPAPANGFQWGGWGYARSDGGGGAILCRNGQVGTLGNHMAIDAGQVGVRLLTAGVPAGFALSYTFPVLDRFYRCMVARNGVHVELRVNGAVVDASDDFPDEEMDSSGYVVNASGWKIGVSGDTGNLGAAYRTGPVEIYDYYPSLSDDLEIFLSALNRLPFHAYSNVLPSAVWYSQPDTTPVHFPSFRHNFEGAMLERISFLTNNSKTLGGSVEGSEMRPKPRREVEMNFLVRSDSERTAFRARLWAHQNRTWFVPIRQDFNQLTSSLSSGVQTIPTPTQYKDYEVDSWVGIRELDSIGNIVKSEVLKIDALNPNDVHTTTATANSYSAFLSYVYPVRRGIISRSLTVRGHTDAVEEIVLVFELLPQDEAVIPNRITPWTPTILYKEHEAHDPAVWQSHNWSDGRGYDIDRALSRIDFETGIFEIESDTPGAEETFEYRMLLKGRDKIAQFLGWFYARGGSLTYLWVPSMQKDFSIISAVGSDLTVLGTNYTENFALAEARRDVAFVYLDNTMELRRINGFSGSGNEVLTFESPGIPSTSNLRSLSILKFCQMEGDSVELAWVTDDLVQVAWRFKELLSTP